MCEEGVACLISVFRGKGGWDGVVNIITHGFGQEAAIG